MDQPPIENGGVLLVGDRIADVAPAAEIKTRVPHATVIDYGSAALLPGLINAHTHLELTHRPRIDFDGDIAGWLLRQRPSADLTPEQRQAEVESATRAGIAQCLRFGVTCVGDISQQCQWTRPILADSPLQGFSFGEVLGLGKLRGRVQQMIESAWDTTFATKRLRSSLSPHSPYTLEWQALQTCVASSNGEPLAMHVAEFAEEEEFLKQQSGPFRRLWETAGLWDEKVKFQETTPIKLARRLGMLNKPNLLIHVNYVTDAELKSLERGRASVVFCPRSHAYFRHPPHRWRDMLAAGINVAVGTDSCASSPNLNIVDDIRLLRRQDPSIPAELLWSLVTTRAARAMCREREVGQLSPEMAADLTVFPVQGDEPLSSILDSDCEPIATWIGGMAV